MLREKAEENNWTLLDGKYRGEKECSYFRCRKKFEATIENPFKDVYFCSSECEEKYYIQTTFCGVCSKEITYDERQIKEKPKFCSPECEQKQKEKEEQTIKNYKEEKIRSILPVKYHSLDTYKTELLEKSMGKSLFLWGKVGTGKSVFMADLVKKYVRSREEVEWISYPSFIMKLQNSFKDKEESAYDLAEKVALFPSATLMSRHRHNSGKGFLCIDDLGAEKLTDFVRQITYYIITEREERQLPTIITSNFSLRQIDEQIDSRISSRIAGMCEVLKFGGEDKRLVKNLSTNKGV